MSEQTRPGRAVRSAAGEPYELRGTRATEVWRGDRLVASYTSVAAASQLCDQLNEAYFAGVAAGLQRAGELAMSIALGGTKSRDLRSASSSAREFRRDSQQAVAAVPATDAVTEPAATAVVPASIDDIDICDYCCGTGVIRIERDGPGDPGGAVPCRCRSDVPARCEPPPLVRLGPGGDFTRDLTEEEVRHAPRG